LRPAHPQATLAELSHSSARNGFSTGRSQRTAGIVTLAVTGIPSFSAADVELLANSVRRTLEDLRDANERFGRNDTQIIEDGQRYSVLLEKLQAISGHSPSTQS